MKLRYKPILIFSNPGRFDPVFNLKTRLYISEFLFHFFFLLATCNFLLLTSCSETTNPKEETVTFTGKVTLENQTDHSGVTIALYKPVELDTALVRINQQYPNIGVQISQETEFDHREHTPVATTVSDAQGNWQIENVAKGEYNVVFEKNNYGFRYLTNVDGSSAVNANLAASIILQGTYNQDVIIPATTIVHIANDVVVNALLDIGPNVTFLFANNATLKVAGSINQNNSASGYIKFIQDNSIPSSALILENLSNTTLNKLLIKGFRQGLLIRSSMDITIKHSIFYNMTSGIETFNSSNTLLTNNLINYCKEGIVSTSSQNNIEKNIISNMINYGYETKNDLGSVVRHNLFTKNILSIGINQDGYGFLESVINIQENDFRFNEVHIRSGIRSTPVVNNNNFLNFIDRAVIAGGDVEKTLDFTQNYWGTNDIVLIEGMVYHNTDDSRLSKIDFSIYKNSYHIWYN